MVVTWWIVAFFCMVHRRILSVVKQLCKLMHIHSNPWGWLNYHYAITRLTVPFHLWCDVFTLWFVTSIVYISGMRIFRLFQDFRLFMRINWGLEISLNFKLKEKALVILGRRAELWIQWDILVSRKRFQDFCFFLILIPDIWLHMTPNVLTETRCHQTTLTYILVTKCMHAIGLYYKHPSIHPSIAIQQGHIAINICIR